MAAVSGMNRALYLTMNEAPSPDSQCLAGKRALIVDDDSDARQLLRATLESCQMSVCDAESVEEALSVLDCSSFSVIVSDIGMPERDGYSFIREVRCRPDCESIPAVALTSFVQPEDYNRAL